MTASGLFLDVFNTELGWMASVGIQDRLSFLTIGHTTERAATEASLHEYPNSAMRCWSVAIRNRLIKFAVNPVDNFLDIELDLNHLTEFQRLVIEECRRIPPGETCTYRELAERADSPRAARAVGNTMAANRFPLIIPCHRVIATNGGLGGYSASQGVSLKKQILAAEKQAVLTAC